VLGAACQARSPGRSAVDRSDDRAADRTDPGGKATPSNGQRRSAQATGPPLCNTASMSSVIATFLLNTTRLSSTRMRPW